MVLIPISRAPRVVAALLLLAAILAPRPIVAGESGQSLDSQEPSRSGSRCVSELQWLMADLEANYAGYGDKVARNATVIQAAAEEARKLARAAAGPADCDAALWGYLGAFDDRHLLLRSPTSPGPPDRVLPEPLFASRAPSFRVVSDTTSLIRVPSFAIQNRAAVAALIENHEEEIRARSRLIVDVRQNGGGGDGTFSPLLPILYTGPMHLPGTDYLATVDNGDRWAGLLTEMSGIDDNTRAGILSFAASLRERAGTWMEGSDDVTLTYDEWPRPEHVAILADRWCASACEQFLYLARQSDKVRLYGEPTAGAIDYLNLVFAEFPSGERKLMYPISRSRRLPEEPLDSTGILPDEQLSEETLKSPEGAVAAVERLLTEAHRES